MTPKRTPLYDEHKKLNGRLIDFGGWELPVQYTSQIEEHLACRNHAALFDVSHMGEVMIEGPLALEFVNFVISNDLTKIPIGKAQYSVMCHENGGIVDDIINYRISENKILMIVNASNSDKDFAHLLDCQKKYFAGRTGLSIKNLSPEYSQIALQGPLAEKILQPLATVDLSQIKPFQFVESRLKNGVSLIISRTGYTGEDGFELYAGWNQGPQIWQNLLEVGTPHGLKAAGLGARDTLRTEMKYSLYGHEINDTTNPLEAGLGWVVKLDKADFVGKKALLAIKKTELSRKLVGLKLLDNDRRIARQGYRILSDASGQEGRAVGAVTSGTSSPCLKESIAIGYVESALANLGQKLLIEIRDRGVPAQVVPTPFYQRRTP